MQTSYLIVFWALRGGGAGSWGVIISATIRTFPTFDAVTHEASISLNSSTAVAQLAMLHASHIFDWDHLHAGQYFYLTGVSPSFTWNLTTLFPNTSTVATANASLAPFLKEAAALATSITTTVIVTSINDAVGTSDSDSAGMDDILGSRLIPADVYHGNISAIGETYQKLLDAQTPVCDPLFLY